MNQLQYLQDRFDAQDRQFTLGGAVQRSVLPGAGPAQMQATPPVLPPPIPALPPSTGTFGPTLEMSLVEPMQLRDLGDTFGTESRLRRESLRTQRRRFHTEQQRHYAAYNVAEQQLAQEARRRAAEIQLAQEQARRNLEAQARMHKVELAQVARAQDEAKVKLEGEAQRVANQAVGLTQAQRDIQAQMELHARQRAGEEAHLVQQQRQLLEFEQQLRHEREALQKLHEQQARENEQIRVKKEALSAQRQQQAVQEQDLHAGRQRIVEAEGDMRARYDADVADAYERGLNAGRAERPPMPPPMTPGPPTPPPPPPASTAGAPMQDATARRMGEARVPPNKDPKMRIRNFDGTETYKGLGAGFRQWAMLFVEELEVCEKSCGYYWTEQFKLIKLSQHLRLKAAEYFDNQRAEWQPAHPTLKYAIAQMTPAFTAYISTMQCAALFKAKKTPGKSWSDHFLYLVAVRNATGASSSLILENIVLYASADMRNILLAKWDKGRSDLANWAQEIDDSSLATRTMGQTVGAVTPPETRTCHNCGKAGHLAAACRKPKGDSDDEGKAKRVNFVLAAGEAAPETTWILDSGASRHLIADWRLLYELEDCAHDDGLTQPDVSTLRMTHKGKADLRVLVDGKEVTVTLTNVWYAPQLKRNLISYGRLVQLGCELAKVNERHALTVGGEVVFYTRLQYDVLVVEDLYDGAWSSDDEEDCVGSIEDAGGDVHVAMAVLASVNVPEVSEGQRGTLMEFHHRFGHLSYDTIEKMAKDPASGIVLTSNQRKNCLTCAEGKQTRANQPTKDSGESAPTDRVGAVICSDIKGPISPRDRNSNRYMINFVDHKSNYVRIFLAPTKDKAAEKFKHFLVWFEKRFDCRIHVLRTDSGAEYNNVDLFCEETGVVRQKTEAKNQAGNGKAERMHRTIMNMVRCMLFSSVLALDFWGHAVQYAAYILNRMPTRANAKQKSPLEMLENKVPSKVNVVVSGSKCTVFRDPEKNPLKRRGEVGIVIGKNDEIKGYRVYLPKDRKVITTRHVQNLETLSEEANAQLKAVLEEEAEQDLEDLARERQKERQAADRADEEAEAEAAEATRPPSPKRKSSKPKTPEERVVRRSEREKKKSARQKEAEEGAAAARGTIALVLAAVARLEGDDARHHADLPDPKNYNEALRSPDRQLWVRVHDEELASLIANGTWTLVRATRAMKRLHTKWVHKKKKLSTGEIERYKARLVACGNEQVLGRDYVLVFAAVMDMVSMKFVLALAAIWGVPARHFDVPSAYVKADVRPSTTSTSTHLKVWSSRPRN